MGRSRRGIDVDMPAGQDQPAVAVDLDGTILEYDPPEYPALGNPIPGAVAGLQALRALGYRLVVHTCRIRGLPEVYGADGRR